MLFTATDSGTAGNSITVEIELDAASVDIVVTADAEAGTLVVTAGQKRRMTVVSPDEPDIHGVELLYKGIAFGSHVWASSTLGSPLSATPTGDGVKLHSDGSSACVLIFYAAGVAYTQWADFTPSSWPDGDTLEPYDGGTYNVTLTSASPTAAEIIAAVNADEDAAEFIIAAAPGTVTGAIAAVAETNLSGGLDGPTPAPGIVASGTGSPTDPPDIAEVGDVSPGTPPAIVS